MPLTSLSLNAQLSWSLQGASGQFQGASESDSESFSLANLSTTTFNQLFAQQFTVAAGSYVEFSLLDFTNLVNESVSLGHALTLFILPSGANSELAPGGTNPLDWFFQSSTPLTLPNGGIFLYSLPASATGQAVTATANTLRVTNTDTSPLSVIVLLLGSTS